MESFRNFERAHASPSVTTMKSMVIAELKKYAQQLAVLPPSATRLLQLAQNPRTELSQIAAVVKTDPSLAGKILSVVNSPSYAGRVSGPISSIERAISRVGLETLKGVVIQTSMTARVLRIRGLEAMVRRMTRHTVFAAAATRALARSIGLDAELGFTIGLLHDVGKVVVLEAYARAPEDLKRDIAVEAQGLAPILVLTHEEVGAHVAKTWSLSDMVVESIGHHHTMADRHRAMVFPLLACAGNMIAHQLEPDPDRENVDVRETPEVYQLGVDRRAIEGILKSVGQEAAALLSALA